MLSLDTTNRTLAILLTGSVTTSELVWVTTYTLYTAAGLTPGTSHGTTNAATAVTVVPAPGAAEYRQLKFFSCRNADTTTKTLIVRYVDSATNRDILRVTLDVGDSLEYTTGHGWYVLTSAGAIKSAGAGGSALPPDGTYADIVVSGSGLTWTISNDAVTYAKMQNVSATSRFLGRITSGAGNTEELTGTQATSLLGTFTNTLNGLVPLSGGGTTNYLRADGTWAAPPSGGTPSGGNNEVQYNIGGAFSATSELKWNTSLHTLEVNNTGTSFPCGWFTNSSNIAYLANSNYAISLVGIYCTDQVTTSVSTLGSVIGREPVFDNSQNLIGFRPIYDNIT